MEFQIKKPFSGDYPISFKFWEAPKWYLDKYKCPHNGVDFAMNTGTPILACADGQVSYCDNSPDADGMGVNLTHSWGLSQYWHFSKVIAILGQKVKCGDLLGYSGMTGFATGPHLHFGIKVKNNPPITTRGWVNPVLYFVESVTEPAPQPVGNRKYVVRFGDTLWKISERYYGTGIYWRKIYNANLARIKNPNKIYPFQIFDIP